MPAGTDSELAARLAKHLVDLYAQAEADLLAAIARRVARGIDQPGWAEAKLAEITQLRAEAEARLAQLQADLEPAVRRLIGDAHTAGAVQADADLARIGIRTGFGRTNTAVVDTYVRQAVTNLEGTHLRIFRSVMDAYRDAVVEDAGRVAAGTATRREVSQRVLDRLADQGITGFVDRAGRNWQLDTYAEMTARTAAGRAQVQGALDRYQAAGKDLVIVSDAPQECPACRPWEGRVLSISGATTGDVGGGMTVAGTVAEAVGAGLQHANCFPGDVLVSGPPVDAADARWYEGDLVVIHTAGGDELPVTPNHPVLTAEGWVSAGALHVGDQLVRHLDPERMRLVGPDEDRVPTPISQVAGALRQAGPVVAVSVPASAEQFHGDGVGGQVDVVLADRLLGGSVDAPVEHPCGHASLVVGGVGLSPLLAEGSPLEVLVGAGHPTDGLMCTGHLPGTLVLGHAGPLASLGLAASDSSATDLDPSSDRGLSDAEGGRQLILALAGSVALDEIIDLGRREFSGHVYNLQTQGGWYTANGIVVHNCRHRLGLYVPGLTRPMHGTADPEGDANRQQQRYLERGVRRWKRREVAALDDQAAAAARAKTRQWQGRLRDHVDTHDLKRLRYREVVGSAH